MRASRKTILLDSLSRESCVVATHPQLYFWCMSRLRQNAQQAKAMLGDEGALRRVASLATVERGDDPEEWIVSALDSSGDGGIYSTIFTGPLARDRAIEYAQEKYSGFELRKPGQPEYR